MLFSLKLSSEIHQINSFKNKMFTIMKNIVTVPLEAFRWDSCFGLRTCHGHMWSWMVEKTPLIFIMVFALEWAWWNWGHHGISVWKRGRGRWQYLICNTMQCGKLALFHNFSCLQAFLSCPFCGCVCFVCRGGESFVWFWCCFWLAGWFVFLCFLCAASVF